MKIKRLSEARVYLFERKLGDPDKLPPTSGSLYQHVLRVHHQCNMWRQSYIPMQDIASLLNFGWIYDGRKCMSVTTEDPIAPEEVLKNLICNCKAIRHVASFFRKSLQYRAFLLEDHKNSD